MRQFNRTANNQQYSNVQPIGKFCFLYIITFGLYLIPWGHKHWKFIKEREGLNINAWLRSWFLPLTLYWLAKKIFALAEVKGYREKPSPALINGLYVFFLVLRRLPDPIWLISLFSFLPLLTILKAANYYWKKEQPYLPLKQSWTGGEIAWAVLGVIFWLLVLIGLFVPT